MKLSIIICTYNRVEFLDLCIKSIQSQIKGVDWAELIVVDNASKDNTSSLLKEKYDGDLTYLYEGNQGLSYARNTGFKNARGEWVAYIDDDAILRKGWLNAFLYAIDFYSFDCFGGPYYPWYKNGKENWFPDIFGSNRKWLYYNCSQEIDKEFSGGNAVYRRSLLEGSTLFPVELGMNGDNQSYGEETFLINWLRCNRNAKVGYVHELAIDHYVDRNKQVPAWYIKRAFSEGRDFALSRSGFQRKIKYLVKCCVQALLLPVVIFELFIRNNFRLSFKAVLVESLRPVMKIIGFLTVALKIK